jgi:hypothetical protein
VDTTWATEINEKLQYAQVQHIPGICKNCCQCDGTLQPLPKNSTEKVVSEDDFCGKSVLWARRKEQGRMLLPMKVFHPNHPDYSKLFPSDDDDCTQEI